MNVTYNFSDKVALVVGGASGMGKATSTMLAEAGAKVMIADFNDELGMQVVRELSDSGANIAYTHCDCREKEDCFSAVDATVARFGRIDYAANVVGISGKIDGNLLVEQDDKNWDNVFATNVDGHRWLLQAEISHMLDQGGEGYSIVEVASMQGFVANPLSPAYTASKHALVGLIKAVGAEYAAKGIRVNGIAPVATMTPFVTEALKQAGMEVTNKTDRVPRGTMLEPEECAAAIMWLLSDGASAMNATTINVDGGALGVK